MILKLTELDTPVEVKFLSTTPETVEGRWGPQYKYSIEVRGERGDWYATEHAHNEVQGAKIAAGETHILMKKPTDGGKSVIVIDPASKSPTPASLNTVDTSSADKWQQTLDRFVKIEDRVYKLEHPSPAMPPEPVEDDDIPF